MLDPKIQIGTIVQLWPDSPLRYKRNEKIFGRVIAIETLDDFVEEDPQPWLVVIQDFPTIGCGISFVFFSEFNKLKIVEGSGNIPWTVEWRKIGTKWVPFSLKTGEQLSND